MQADAEGTDALVRSAGLDLSADELREVAALREQFAAQRQTLSSIDLRAVEPMTVFAPRHEE
jgi:hypothetical protein